MLTLSDDLTHALRRLWRRPGSTVLALLTLTVGIAATSTVFSIVSTVVLKPLPFLEQERLVRLWEVSPEGSRFSVSAHDFLDYRARSHSLSDLVAVQRSLLTLLGEVAEGDSPSAANPGARRAFDPQQVVTIETTPGLFELIGVRPLLGLTLPPGGDDPANAAAAVVLSHGLWQGLFSGDPQIIGRWVEFDGSSREVVGVMPPGADFPFGAEIWVPLALDPEVPRAEHRLEVFGRLVADATLEKARAEFATISANLGDQYPDSNAGWGVALLPFRQWLVGPQVTRVNLVLLGAVLLLLLLGCASVSNLFLAQTSVRETEIGTRIALGAARRRIVRQLLAESLVLGMIGAAIGLVLAAWLVGLVRGLEIDALPRLDQVRLDARAVSATMVVSLLAALLAGLTPALRAARTGVAPVLSQTSRTVSGGNRRLREVLVVLQVALAMILLVGSGLFLGSLSRLAATDPGFDPKGVLAVELGLPASRYPEMSPETALFYQQLEDRVAGLPGVVAVGATMVNPFSGLRPANWVARADQAATPESRTQIQFRSVTPGYFRAAGVPLLSGRLLDSGDRLTPGATEEDPPSGFKVVISRSLARRFWEQVEEAPGHWLLWGGEAGGLELEVVGVVGDVQDVNLGADAQPLLFFSHQQIPWPAMTVLVKTAGDPASAAPGVRQALRELDPRLPAGSMRPLAESFEDQIAGPGFSAVLMTVFAAAALLVAIVGIYGLVSLNVQQRRRELAIRLSFGAPPGRMIRWVARRGLYLTGAGIVLGGLTAFALGRVVQSLLYELSSGDATTYVAAAVILTGAALVAGLVPAWRVTRVNLSEAVAAE